jgi:hypothetical protein
MTPRGCQSDDPDERANRWGVTANLAHTMTCAFIHERDMQGAGLLQGQAKLNGMQELAAQSDTSGDAWF